MRQLIKNARIIDGTGKAQFLGQIVIENDTIKEIIPDLTQNISNVDLVIDAQFAFISPGFIDVHSHADLSPFVPQGFKPKVTQGVTSELVGLCGLGVAPIPKHLQPHLRQKLIIGDPNITWNWEDTASYLNAVQQSGLEVNLGAFTPHGLLRMQICNDSVLPMNNNELKQLEELANKSLTQGSLGISLGLIYHPAIYSNEEELKVLAKVAANYHKPLVVHMRSESDEILEALSEIINIAQTYQCQLHISHLKLIGRRNANKLPKLLKIIEKHNLTFDQYPYHFGSTTLLSLLPPAILRDYSGNNLYLALEQKFIRQQIKDWFTEKISPKKGEPWDNLVALLGWNNIIICDLNSQENQKWIGKTIAECAQLTNQDPTDFTINLLIQEQGQVRMIDFFMDEELVEIILKHPAGMIGTDSIFGGQLHPRVLGTFPKIIHQYVNQKHIISLEQAIRKMTSFSANTFELKHRGIIKVGYSADICLFDNNFKDNATMENSKQFATGLQGLWINGERKIINGKYNDLKSGMILL